MSRCLAADPLETPIQPCRGDSDAVVPGCDATEPGDPIPTHTCWFWRAHQLSLCQL